MLRAIIHGHLPCTVFAFFLTCTTNGLAQDTASASTPAYTVQDLLRQSSQDQESGDLLKALGEVSAALQIDPHNAAAYEQRGSIYIQKKLWDRAERDYSTAAKIDPTAGVFKYKLAEIKFLQKSYDEARPRFLSLQADAYLGDLAVYKILLCDLFSGHETRAAQDLDLINKGTNPSYYFGNAAWDLFHDKKAEANILFASASHIYDSSKCDLYISGLMETQLIKPTTVTFTTKNGDHYENAPIFVQSTGLYVTTTSGPVTVPLDQLPDDLSSFPTEIRTSIVDVRGRTPLSIIDTSRLSFTTRQGKHYDRVQWSTEDTGLRVLTSNGWVTIPFNQLPDDLSTFPADLQKNIALKRPLASTVIDEKLLVSFATKKGKQFDQTEANLSDDGVRVLTSDGWITIPFNQLPDDLAPFPTEWQKQIQAKRLIHSDGPMRVVSFTTTAGRRYDQVRGMIQDAGLRILTSEGAVTVPFKELPDDLSAFPEEWRDQIKMKQKSASGTPVRETFVSFTAKNGKLYDQVRVTIGVGALRVLTSDGWVSVPLKELPDDLSVFPEVWRRQILAKQREATTQFGSLDPIGLK